MEKINSFNAILQILASGKYIFYFWAFVICY